MDYMKTIKEAYEIFNKDDIDKAPKDEKEFALKNNDPSMWIKLGTYYNWDNSLEEILYFFKRDPDEEKLHAVSFGRMDFSPIHQGGYLIRLKEFTVRFNGTLEYADEPGDDPWEIEKNDLEESDADSIADIIKNVFIAPEMEVWDNALKVLK